MFDLISGATSSHILDPIIDKANDIIITFFL